MTEEQFAEITVAIWRKRQEIIALKKALDAKQITWKEFYQSQFVPLAQLAAEALKLTSFGKLPMLRLYITAARPKRHTSFLHAFLPKPPRPKRKAA